MTTPSDEAALARSLAQATVAALFPDELPFFEELSHETPAQGRPGGEDSPLGFGLQEAVQLFTPVVLAVASSLVSHVASQAASALREELGDRVKERVRQVLNPKDPQRPVSITDEQLARVHEQSLRQLADFGVEPATAAKIADALIGGLVLGR